MATEGEPTAPTSTAFGRYTLLEQLAVGGMAEVFRAKISSSHGFEKILVIKRILPHLAADPNFVSMFIDEAKLTAQLTHPKIVQVLEFGEVRGQFFIAMEFIDGFDALGLLRVAAQKRVHIPRGLAVFIISEVLDALDYAHNARDMEGKPMHIVHRDISPSNIFMSKRGDVKLGDFGIAHAQRRESKTQAGTLKGKYGYMSPEQVVGRPVDARSDLFSVGVAARRDAHRAAAVLRARGPRRAAHGPRREARSPGQVRRRSAAGARQDRPAFAQEEPRRPFSVRGRVPRRAGGLPVRHRAAGAPQRPARVRGRPVRRQRRRRGAHAPGSTSHGGTEASQGPRDRGRRGGRRQRGSTGGAAPAPAPASPPAAPAASFPSTPTLVSDVVSDAPTAQTSPPTGQWPEDDSLERSSVRGFTPVARPGEPSVHTPALRPMPTGRPTTHSDVGRFVSAAPKRPPDSAGDVSIISPMRLFCDLALAGETGLLQFGLDDVQKEIFLVGGAPESVSSSNPSERFGEYLVARKVLGPSDLDLALSMLPHYNGKLGDTLVALGLLRPLDVFRLLSEQVRDRVIDVFMWSEGTFAFYRGATNRQENFPLGLDTFEILGASVLNLPFELCERRFAEMLDYRPIATGRGRVEPEAFHLGPTPREVLALLDGSRTLRDWMAQFGDREELLTFLRSLYLLVETDLAELD